MKIGQIRGSSEGTYFQQISGQKGKFETQNVRVDSMLEDFGLKSRIFSGDFEKLFVPVDFGNVNKRLEEVRECSPFVEWIKSKK